MSDESTHDRVKRTIDEMFDNLGRTPKRVVARREVSVRMSDGRIVVTDRDSHDEIVQTETMSYAAAKDHVAQLQNAIATIDAAIAAGVVKVVEKG
jgi:hypothetical protein